MNDAPGSTVFIDGQEGILLRLTERAKGHWRAVVLVKGKTLVRETEAMSSEEALNRLSEPLETPKEETGEQPLAGSEEMIGLTESGSQPTDDDLLGDNFEPESVDPPELAVYPEPNEDESHLVTYPEPTEEESHPKGHEGRNTDSRPLSVNEPLPSPEIEDAQQESVFQPQVEDLTLQSLDVPFQPRRYQLEAVEAWRKAGCRGLFNMATGTGKTKASLLAVATEWPDVEVVVVACPTSILVQQWLTELRETFPHSAIFRVGRDQNWREAGPLPEGPAFLIGTMNMLCREFFTEWFQRTMDCDRAMLIADEAHRIGAPAFSRILRVPFGYRLGLSATPRRDWDEFGNAKIKDFFEGEVFNYSLAEALENGFLVPYTYHIHPLPLEQLEREQYQELSVKIINTLSALGFDPKNDSLIRFVNQLERTSLNEAEILKSLWIKRSRLLKEAQGKQRRVREVFETHDFDKCLVYCNTEIHLDNFQKILSSENIPTVRYTGVMNDDERHEALKAFDGGLVRAMLSIKCLDEGVDIPDARSALLISSSTSEREFIQRRGRVLRKAPNKTEASVHDLLVLPVDPDSFHGELTPYEITLVGKELRRLLLFNDHAINREENLNLIKILVRKLGLPESTISSDEDEYDVVESEKVDYLLEAEALSVGPLEEENGG